MSNILQAHQSLSEQFQVLRPLLDPAADRTTVPRAEYRAHVYVALVHTSLYLIQASQYVYISSVLV